MKINEYFVQFSVYFQRITSSEKVEIVSTRYFNTAFFFIYTKPVVYGCHAIPGHFCDLGDRIFSLQDIANGEASDVFIPFFHIHLLIL